MEKFSAKGRERKVVATFELTVVGKVRPRTAFFGHVARGMMVEASAELTDQNGVGTYTGSTRVEHGVERTVGIVVGYDGLSDIVHDFGLVKFDQDRTFVSSVLTENLYRL